MPEPLTCAWCDQPATREVTVVPPRTTHIKTNGGKQKIVGLSHREPACEDHAQPEQRTDPPRRKKGEQLEGQMDIFDVLGDAA